MTNANRKPITVSKAGRVVLKVRQPRYRPGLPLRGARPQGGSAARLRGGADGVPVRRPQPPRSRLGRGRTTACGGALGLHHVALGGRLARRPGRGEKAARLAPSRGAHDPRPPGQPRYLHVRSRRQPPRALPRRRPLPLAPGPHAGCPFRSAPAENLSRSHNDSSLRERAKTRVALRDGLPVSLRPQLAEFTASG
jgi:hypothetical protein